MGKWTHRLENNECTNCHVRAIWNDYKKRAICPVATLVVSRRIPLDEALVKYLQGNKPERDGRSERVENRLTLRNDIDAILQSTPPNRAVDRLFEYIVVTFGEKF